VLATLVVLLLNGSVAVNFCCANFFASAFLFKLVNFYQYPYNIAQYSVTLLLDKRQQLTT
jgi:hypothetical protein